MVNKLRLIARVSCRSCLRTAKKRSFNKPRLYFQFGLGVKIKSRLADSTQGLLMAGGKPARVNEFETPTDRNLV